MMNDLEMNELISSVIYDSDNISPVVNIKGGTGETVTVDITKLKPGTDRATFQQVRPERVVLLDWSQPSNLLHRP